jgi:transcriptional regulator with XRE-family HTH domain
MRIKGIDISIAIARKGYSQKEFAELCGLSTQTLWQTLKRNTATMTTLVKVSDVLSIPVKELIEDNERS